MFIISQQIVIIREVNKSIKCKINIQRTKIEVIKSVKLTNNLF